MLAQPELYKELLSVQTHYSNGFSKSDREPEPTTPSLEPYKTVKKRNPRRRASKKISKKTVNIKLIQTNMDGFTSKKESQIL